MTGPRDATVLAVSLMALIEALPDSMRVARAVDARLESFSALMLELRSEAAYQSFLDHRQQLVAGLLARGQ